VWSWGGSSCRGRPGRCAAEGEGGVSSAGTAAGRGSWSTRHVCAVAEMAGVSERTVWCWLEQAKTTGRMEAGVRQGSVHDSCSAKPVTTNSGDWARRSLNSAASPFGIRVRSRGPALSWCRSLSPRCSGCHIIQPVTCLTPGGAGATTRMRRGRRGRDRVPGDPEARSAARARWRRSRSRRERGSGYRSWTRTSVSRWWQPIPGRAPPQTLRGAPEGSYACGARLRPDEELQGPARLPSARRRSPPRHRSRPSHRPHAQPRPRRMSKHANHPPQAAWCTAAARAGSGPAASSAPGAQVQAVVSVAASRRLAVVQAPSVPPPGTAPTACSGQGAAWSSYPSAERSQLATMQRRLPRGITGRGIGVPPVMLQD
jgi:hypothetical protein